MKRAVRRTAKRKKRVLEAVTPTVSRRETMKSYFGGGLAASLVVLVLAGSLLLIGGGKERASTTRALPHTEVPLHIPRIWMPEDTVFVRMLSERTDSFAVVQLFSDPRFGMDERIAARFMREDTGTAGATHRRPPYWWLLTDTSFARGRTFLNANRVLLDTVGRAFGVSPEVIAAVLRTESDFGAVAGDFVAVNTLYTRARLLRSEKRRDEELAQLACIVEMATQKGIDPFVLRGSHAAALYDPQFRPCSYLAYAVDGDGDGTVNLSSLPDAAASIANYLREKGWSSERSDQWRALYRYNKAVYADAVLTYAERIAHE